MAAGLVLLVQPLLPERSAATLAGDPIAARVVWETTPLDWPAGYNVLIPAGTTAIVNLGAQTPEYSVPFFGLGGSRFKIDFFTGPSIGGSTNALSIHVDFADLGVWPIPSTFQVSLSGLDWGGTPGGRITGIVKVSGQPNVLEVIGFTDDSITLGMGSRVVIGGTGFDVEYRYAGTDGGATTLGPFSVADVFLTPPCWSSGGCTPANFPQNWGTVRTFTYTIPAGQSVLDARIKGTWGGTFFNSTAPIRVYLEGILVAECLASQPCWDEAVKDEWNGGAGFLLSDLGVNFGNPAVRALFEDGSAGLSVIQTDVISTNISNLNLTLTVPEPAGIAPLLAGLASLGVCARARARRLAVLDQSVSTATGCRQ